MMRWSDEIWLLDLQPCLSYWLYQADRSACSLNEFFRRFLKQVCGDSNYYAGLASEAWQALLLLKTLEGKGIHGLVARDTRLGENLYRDISWSCWWHCCEEYIAVSTKLQHLAQHKARQVKQDIHRMELAVKRLGIRRPIQLKELADHQIKRRFGDILADLWKKTFPKNDLSIPKLRNSLKEKGHECLALRQSSFPWSSYDLQEKPTKKRTLDYPVFEWNHIEVYLCADLNALCFLDSFKKEQRIINLEWRVVLQDQKEIRIFVPFRHPHDLHRESPHYRTALLQVRYQFEQQVSRVEQGYRDIDSPPPPIVAWQLKILQTLTISSVNPLLFNEDGEEQERLLDLENRLPISLQAFHSRVHWLPEDSYQSSSIAEQNLVDATYTPAEQACLLQLARHRPLYICPHPRRFKPTGESGLWKFQERTMDKWWTYDPANQHRDYYRYISGDRCLWVFQNSSAQWYVHGVFA